MDTCGSCGASVWAGLDACPSCGKEVTRPSGHVSLSKDTPVAGYGPPPTGQAPGPVYGDPQANLYGAGSGAFPPPPAGVQGYTYGQPFHEPGFYPHHGGSPVGPVGFASVGTRIGAFLLDGVFMFMINSVINFPLALLFAFGSGVTDSFAAAIFGNLLTLTVWLGLWVGYLVAPTAMTGQTLGKKLLNIKVVREADGAVPGWGGAFVRYLVMGLLALPFYVPLLINACLMGSDPKIRGWHDKAIGTVVVRA